MQHCSLPVHLDFMHSAIVANSNHEMHVATVAFVSAVAVVVIADDVVMAVKVAACWLAIAIYVA